MVGQMKFPEALWSDAGTLLQEAMTAANTAFSGMRRACGLSLSVALACGTAPRPPTLGRDAPSLVIQHATVIDPRDGTILSDRSIAIRRDRIIAVTVPDGAVFPA